MGVLLNFSIFAFKIKPNMSKSTITLFLVLAMQFLSLQGWAQNKPSKWLDICNDVKNNYSSATHEKKQAAAFLLENAPYHLTKINDTLTSYYNRLAQINKDNKYPHCKSMIADLYHRFNMLQQFDWVSDTLLLTSKYLIDDIDSAYTSWKEGRYANHLTFDDFCEYLLPYRVGTENISRWRKELSDRFSHRIDWMQTEDDKKSSAYWAALYINDQIKNLGFHIDGIKHYGGIDLPYPALKNIKMGECEDYAELTAYVMRSCGIPVSVDFTPQWPFRSSGHYWNTVLDNSGRNIPFMGGESNPGYPCKAGYVMGKVYRKTYAYQKESLFALNSKYSELVPSLLNTPFVKDVSKEYVRGVEVMATQNDAVKLNRHFLYLSVFNNKDWIPIAYAEKDSSNKASFHDVGAGIVYLPVVWTMKGSRQANYPILVKANGEVCQMKPNMKRTQVIRINRKYPVFGGVLFYSKRVVNGHFEAANNQDFTDAVTVGTITRNPLMRYDSLAITQKGKYRYWRYVSPKNGHCNVAEIIFKKAKHIVPFDSIINDGTTENGYDVKYAFDNDELSFYESKKADNGWIGVDFGKAVSVDNIVYLPRNDDNNVVPGHLYELDYYDGTQTVSLGVKKSCGYEITFEGVPTNALYILHDLSKGSEERIFTYENGKVKWY